VVFEYTALRRSDEGRFFIFEISPKGKRDAFSVHFDEGISDLSEISPKGKREKMNKAAFITGEGGYCLDLKRFFD
jgi:hypothetical protein